MSLKYCAVHYFANHEYEPFFVWKEFFFLNNLFLLTVELTLQVFCSLYFLFFSLKGRVSLTLRVNHIFVYEPLGSSNL